MESNKGKHVVVGIGEVLWDVFPTDRKAGGAPVNFVYHATISGADGYAISAIGNDELGREIFDLVDKIGIKHLIETVAQPTGTVQVTLTDGNPEYVITENVAWDFIPFNDEMKSLAQKTDAVCFGTLAQRSDVSRQSIRKFLSFAPDSAYKILDLNLRNHFFSEPLIDESIRLCNVLKVNDDEFLFIKKLYLKSELSDDEAVAWMISNFGLKYFILTSGADYSNIYSSDQKSHIKTPKVEVVDTVGAGDSFTGAFVAAIVKGEELKSAHAAAVDRAAKVCTIAGAWL